MPGRSRLDELEDETVAPPPAKLTKSYKIENESRIEESIDQVVASAANIIRPCEVESDSDDSIEILPSTSTASKDFDPSTATYDYSDIELHQLPLPSSYTCPQCRKEEESTEELEEHIMKVHLSYKAWRCTLCMASRYSKEQLERHYDAQHNLKSPEMLYTIDLEKSRQLRTMMITALVNAGRKEMSHRIELQCHNRHPQPQQYELDTESRGSPENEGPIQMTCSLCKVKIPSSFNAKRHNNKIIDHASFHMFMLFNKSRYRCLHCKKYSGYKKCGLLLHTTQMHKGKNANFEDLTLKWDSTLIREVSQLCFEDENFVLQCLATSFKAEVILNQAETEDGIEIEYDQEDFEFHGDDQNYTSSPGPEFEDAGELEDPFYEEEEAFKVIEETKPDIITIDN